MMAAGTQTLAMDDIDNNVTANGKRQNEHGSTATKVRLMLLLLPHSDSYVSRSFLTCPGPRYNEMPPAFLSVCIAASSAN